MSEDPQELFARARFQFIMTELNMALTFLGIAETTADENRVTRNLQFARRAYDTANHFLASAQLTVQMREVLNDKLEQVQAAFEAAAK